MKFSKKDTIQIKGIAILMLVIYHCFATKERLLGYPVAFKLPQKMAFYIAESMNICVGMFAFLSAYGLTIIYSKKQGKEKNKFIPTRYISLLASFLIPYLVCAGITAATTGIEAYGKGTDAVLNVAMDMLGLAGWLKSPMLVGTYWYMSFAIVIIFLVPIVAELRKKSVPGVIVLFLVIPVFFFERLTNMTRWLLCIPLGVWFAEERILERLKEKQYVSNPVINKILKFIVMTIILVFLVKLRTGHWGKKYAYYVVCSVLPVFFVYYCYEFFVDIWGIKHVLMFLGKHSGNIFYVHTFIRGVWLGQYTYSLKEPVLIVLFVIGLSVVISIAMETFKKVTHYNEFTKSLMQRI